MLAYFMLHSFGSQLERHQNRCFHVYYWRTFLLMLCR